MSKLSFRARALDPSKPMPIFLAEELPDLPEYSAINRAVPQMPSGMEKEEESEHHLQRAICTGLIIPTPEVFPTDGDFYERAYPPDYKMPRQLIRMQPLGLEQDIPDYDMDSADEAWVNLQSKRLDITPLKFELMMDKLEKSSGQTVATLNEAKALLKQDDEISIAVYDYWLNKRLKMQHPLILSVKTENRSGQATNNPYLAFRRRTEKMQTRKNRKNDETSYEKMLKLRRDLSRAVTLLEMVKRREKAKREHLNLTIEIVEKRYQARDFSGTLLAELSSNIKTLRPAFAPIYSNQYSHHLSFSQLTSLGFTTNNLQNNSLSLAHSSGNRISTSQYLKSGNLLSGSSSTGINVPSNKRDFDVSATGGINVNIGARREKRQYKKRKHKTQREKLFSHHLQSSSPVAVESNLETDEEDISNFGIRPHSNNNGNVSETEDEGPYTFRRHKNCGYHKPSTNFGNWPWESREENELKDTKYRFTLTSLRKPKPKCIGFARKRIGRGGRIILDRVSTNFDDLWSQWDYTIFKNNSETNEIMDTSPIIENLLTNSLNFENLLNNNYKNSSKNISTNPSMSKTTITESFTTSSLSTSEILSLKEDKFEDLLKSINMKEGLKRNFIKKLKLKEEEFSDLSDSSDELSNEENISRDNNYISISAEPLHKCPTTANKNLLDNLDYKKNKHNINKLNSIHNKLRTKKLKIFNIYNNSLLTKNNCGNSINNFSNYLQSKKVKREQNSNDNQVEHMIENKTTSKFTMHVNKKHDVNTVNNININNNNNSFNNNINDDNCHNITNENLNVTNEVNNEKRNRYLKIEKDSNNQNMCYSNITINKSNNNHNTRRYTDDKQNDNDNLNKSDNNSNEIECSNDSISINNKNVQHNSKTSPLSNVATNATLSQFSSSNIFAVNLLVRQDGSSNINKSSFPFSNNVNLNNRNMNVINNNNISNKIFNDKFNVIKQEMLNEEEIKSPNKSKNYIAPENLNDLSDDENVNLARLSSYINAANKQISKNSSTKIEEITTFKSKNNISISGTINLNNSLCNNNVNNNNRSLSTFDLLKSQSNINTNNSLINLQQKLKSDLSSNSNSINSKLFHSNKLLQDPYNDHSISKNCNNNKHNNAINNKDNHNINFKGSIINGRQNDQKQEEYKLTENNKDNTESFNNLTKIFEEIQRDWLHFRPKTPPILEIENEVNSDLLLINEPIVQFSETTPITVEMIDFLNKSNLESHRNLYEKKSSTIDSKHNKQIEKNNFSTKCSSQTFKDCSYFLTYPFTYSDLISDDHFMVNQYNSIAIQNPVNPGICAYETLRNTFGHPISYSHQIDFGNLSGESLTELNLSLGEEDNEKILENILQECQIDDIKTLNQTTSFWNGILEDNGNMLDGIEEKKSIDNKMGYTSELGIIHLKNGSDMKQNKLPTIGCSNFSVENHYCDGNFFKNILKDENDLNVDATVKIEPPEDMFIPQLRADKDNVEKSKASVSDVSQVEEENKQKSSQQCLYPIKSYGSMMSLMSSQNSLKLSSQKELIRPNNPLSLTSERQSIPISSNVNNKSSIDTATKTQIVKSTEQQQSRSYNAVQAHTALFSPLQNTNSNQNSSSDGSMAIGQIGNQKFFIKQDHVKSVNQNKLITFNQSQIPNQQNNQAVITLTNIKLENDIVAGISAVGTNSGSVANFVTQSSGTTLIADAGGGISNSLNTLNQSQHGNIILTSTKALQGQTPQTQQHILLQQIGGQNTPAQIINVSNTGGITVADGQGATLVLSGSSPNKRLINGPTDRNTMQNILKQTKLISNRKFQIAHQSHSQFQTVKQDDEVSVTPNGQKATLQSLQPGSFLKVGSYPVVVSDLNVQPTNSLAAVSNHNYSLQPTDDQRLLNNRLQPITIIGQPQSGNKIILNTNANTGNSIGGSSSGNFTITTPIQEVQNKINFTQIPTSNIKVNLVTSSGIQQGNIMVSNPNSGVTNLNQNSNCIDVKNTDCSNKNITIQHHTLHMQQQQQQRIKLEKTLNMYIDSDQKKVLYTKLVNISSLHQQSQQHKSGANGAGVSVSQSSNVQSTPQIMANKASQNVQRLANNQTGIVSNMRMSVGLSNQSQIGENGNITSSNVTNSINPSAQQTISPVDLVLPSSTSTSGGSNNIGNNIIKQQQVESTISPANR